MTIPRTRQAFALPAAVFLRTLPWEHRDYASVRLVQCGDELDLLDPGAMAIPERDWQIRGTAFLRW